MSESGLPERTGGRDGNKESERGEDLRLASVHVGAACLSWI